MKCRDPDPEPKFSPPLTQKAGWVMVVGDEFQSQQSLTISYTNGERLEGLRCCELPKSVSTPSIWVQKVHTVQARTVPTHDQKIGSDELCRAQPPI